MVQFCAILWSRLYTSKMLHCNFICSLFFFYCALHGGFFNSALVTCVQSEYTRTLIDACGIARDNICHIVEAPAVVPYIIRKRSSDVAEKAVSSLEGAGVFAVELFLTSDGQVYFTSS